MPILQNPWMDQMNSMDGFLNSDEQIAEGIEQQILRPIKGIRYGSVENFLHGSKADTSWEILSRLALWF